MTKTSVQKPTGLRYLPSVDEVLGESASAAAIDEIGRNRAVQLLRSLFDELRNEMLAGSFRPAENQNSDVRRDLALELANRLAIAARAEKAAGIRRVINATGVVIHTNLGRAPLSRSAVGAVAAAAGYSSIEYDIQNGARGPRSPRVISLLTHLTGAEDALIVNNCAAAAMLALSVFAQGREVVVSRGELVEIGGDFRIPDVLTRSGAVLREVGTTNRTHLRDYENALTECTAMILKVHPSNYRITGFTRSAESAELAELAHRRNILFYEDAGSGALVDLGEIGITGEPEISKIIAAGADLVSFSGDKLLGGPQAGIIVGRSETVGKLRKDPLYRALRVDKMISAALEATLDSYARGTAKDDIPVLRMLAADKAEMDERSRRFVDLLRNSPENDGGLNVDLVEGSSAVGGGAAPGSPIVTTVIALQHNLLRDVELERRLRLNEPPVIARIEAGSVLIDLRTVDEGEEAELLSAINQISRSEAK